MSLQLTSVAHHLPQALSEPASNRLLSGLYLLVHRDEYVGIGFLRDTATGPVWSTQDGRTLPMTAVTHYAHLPQPRMCSGRAEDSELLDADGYPTSAALTHVRNWPWEDPKGWFSFIETLWYMRSFGACAEQAPEGVLTVKLSTCGWSGNEGLIRAMQANEVLWEATWRSSRAGGHYVFEVRND